MKERMEEDDQGRRELITSWHSTYKKGTDHDLWGQPVEAMETYHRLASQIRLHVLPDTSAFYFDQKKLLKKIAACLELRCKALQSPGRKEEITLDHVKKVENTLANLLFTSSKEFPVHISTTQLHQLPENLVDLMADGWSEVSSVTSKYSEEEEGEEVPDSRLIGNLLPPPAVHPGKTIMTVRLEKIGLKDPSQYIDPYITISVKEKELLNRVRDIAQPGLAQQIAAGSYTPSSCFGFGESHAPRLPAFDVEGRDLTPLQNTPVAARKEDTYVFFGVDVFIQKTLEALPAGFVIFFEFKHYKPKKKIISTKCWSFMEKEEILEGPVVIELYRKPTDYKRKKINLLTVKPLYLHLRITLN